MIDANRDVEYEVDQKAPRVSLLIHLRERGRERHCSAAEVDGTSRCRSAALNDRDGLLVDANHVARLYCFQSLQFSSDRQTNASNSPARIALAMV